jgi:hypothetical protein
MKNKKRKISLIKDPDESGTTDTLEVEGLDIIPSSESYKNYQITDEDSEFSKEFGEEEEDKNLDEK